MAPKTKRPVFPTAIEVAKKFGAEGSNSIAVITGATSGIGFETAHALATAGLSRLILTGLNDQECGDAERKLNSLLSSREETPTLPEINWAVLDLASFDSVQNFAGVVQNLCADSGVGILINNAGILKPGPRKLSVDGFEMHWQVNYLGPFLLVQLLLPLLVKYGSTQKPARVVNVSSSGQILFAPDPQGIPFDNLNSEKSYSIWRAYGVSKLGVVLMAKEISKRYKSQHVIAISVHPGNVNGTDLTKGLSQGLGARQKFQMLANLQRWSYFVFFLEPVKTIPQGAATSVFAALKPDIESGEFYFDCHESKGKMVHPIAKTGEIAARLWDLSLSVLGSQLNRTA